jgi:hypothetical protein
MFGIGVEMGWLGIQSGRVNLNVKPGQTTNQE